MNFENQQGEPKPAEALKGPKPDVEKKPETKPEAKTRTPEEIKKIQELMKKRFADRMSGVVSYQEIDDQIRAEGLTPMTGPADEFMKKKDIEWAEKEYEKRREGERMLDRLVGILSLAAGHENSAEFRGKAFRNILESIKVVDGQEKITKENLGLSIGKIVEGLSPEVFPWLAKFKDKKDETFRRLTHDLVDAIKTGNDEERKLKIQEVIKTYEIEGDVREDFAEVTKDADEILREAGSSETGGEKKKKLENLQGGVLGLKEKIFSVLGLMSGIIFIAFLATLMLTIFTLKAGKIMKAGKKMGGLI